MKQYIIDAFTDKLFSGNPAAICVTDNWLSDELMQNIANENHLSETAFAVKENEKYHLRWFTPGGEIDLCGHATLACAFVIMNEIDRNLSEVVFTTISGDLTVSKKHDLYEMDFPIYELNPIEITPFMIEAIGTKPLEAYMGRDLLCVFKDESEIISLKPDFEKIRMLDGSMFHATAEGKEFDCVSRSFAPKFNVTEDHVCGSGHCHIVPYWAGRLKKSKIKAYQASERGGILYCNMSGNRVILGGKAVIFSESDIKIENC